MSQPERLPIHLENWSLRLPAAFEELYYERVTRKAALNIPAALALALEARGLTADTTGAQLAASLRSLATALTRGATLILSEVA